MKDDDRAQKEQELQRQLDLKKQELDKRKQELDLRERDLNEREKHGEFSPVKDEKKTKSRGAEQLRMSGE